VKILVTGASGFVGRLLVSRLLETHPRDEVAAFLLPSETLPEESLKKVEVIRGDLRQPETVRAAIRGRDLVFHVAGFISYWVLDAKIMEAVNVGGTKAVVDACIEYKVKRLVHVSSVGAIGFHEDGSESDETTPFNWPESFGYMTTKRDGQKIVMDAVRERGLDAVVVNPASVMGPGDPVPGSAFNRMCRSVCGKRIFIGTFAGGLAVVDVRDLVETILAAAEKGRKGEAYLSVGANLSYKAVLEIMTSNTGTRFIPLVVPTFVLVGGGWIAELFSRLTRKRPLITIAYGQLSGWTAFYSNAKSRRELGVNYRDFKETIADGNRYFIEHFLERR